ncbi:hypothetical protein L2U69_18750 [Zavarzinia compransoris]|uniref:hypothetical protein n=1 Tax=Zavarzinia marina TaxID=2911065 RepID=UPI001F1C84F4|nr:hypothetical protein [Zavarzinia marina]MCF4167692.1 hypothetical protein [Zavarzinia marina]
MPTPARAEGPVRILPDFLYGDPAPPVSPPAPSGPEDGDGPLSLMPPDMGAPVDAGPADGETMPRGAALPPPIEIAPLDTVRPLEGEDVAAPAPIGSGELWLGTPPGLVAPLLANVPAPARGTVPRRLTQRLLMAAPSVPDATARVIEKLAAAGAAEDLASFAGRLAGLPAPSVPHVVRGLAAAGDRRRLCDAGLDRVPGAGGLDVDVLRAVALCRAVAGDTIGAQLALDLAHEQGAVGLGFEHLLRALTGGERAASSDVGGTDPLALWAAAALDLAPPPEAFDDPPPLVLGLLARAKAPIGLRLGAAERGVRLGLVDPADLALLYAGGPAPLAAPADLSPPMRRAVLHRAVLEASGPAVRAQAVVAFVEAAEADGLATVAARVEGRAIADTADQSLPPAIGAGLVRAALRAGDRAAALRQIERLARNAGDSRDLARLWPYRALLAGDAAVPPRFDDFEDALPAGTAGERGGDMTAALLDALGGRRLPDDLAARLDRTGGNPAIPGLDAALAGGRRGEAVALVLEFLGGNGLQGLEPKAAGAAVAGLVRAGLTAEARDLAIEIALAAGL